MEYQPNRNKIEKKPEEKKLNRFFGNLLYTFTKLNPDTIKKTALRIFIASLITFWPGTSAEASTKIISIKNSNNTIKAEVNQVPGVQAFLAGSLNVKPENVDYNNSASVKNILREILSQNRVTPVGLSREDKAKYKVVSDKIIEDEAGNLLFTYQYYKNTEGNNPKFAFTKTLFDYGNRHDTRPSQYTQFENTYKKYLSVDPKEYAEDFKYPRNFGINTTKDLIGDFRHNVQIALDPSTDDNSRGIPEVESLEKLGEKYGLLNDQNTLPNEKQVKNIAKYHRDFNSLMNFIEENKLPWSLLSSDNVKIKKHSRTYDVSIQHALQMTASDLVRYSDWLNSYTTHRVFYKQNTLEALKKNVEENIKSIKDAINVKVASIPSVSVEVASTANFMIPAITTPSQKTAESLKNPNIKYIEIKLKNQTKPITPKKAAGYIHETNPIISEEEVVTIINNFLGNEKLSSLDINQRAKLATIISTEIAQRQYDRNGLVINASSLFVTLVIAGFFMTRKGKGSTTEGESSKTNPKKAEGESSETEGESWKAEDKMSLDQLQGISINTWKRRISDPELGQKDKNYLKISVDIKIGNTRYPDIRSIFDELNNKSGEEYNILYEIAKNIVLLPPGVTQNLNMPDQNKRILGYIKYVHDLFNQVDEDYPSYLDNPEELASKIMPDCGLNYEEREMEACQNWTNQLTKGEGSDDGGLKLSDFEPNKAKLTIAMADMEYYKQCYKKRVKLLHNAIDVISYIDNQDDYVELYSRLEDINTLHPNNIYTTRSSKAEEKNRLMTCIIPNASGFLWFDIKEKNGKITERVSEHNIKVRLDDNGDIAIKNESSNNIVVLTGKPVLNRVDENTSNVRKEEKETETPETNPTGETDTEGLEELVNELVEENNKDVEADFDTDTEEFKQLVDKLGEPIEKPKITPIEIPKITLRNKKTQKNSKLNKKEIEEIEKELETIRKKENPNMAERLMRRKPLYFRSGVKDKDNQILALLQLLKNNKMPHDAKTARLAVIGGTKYEKYYYHMIQKKVINK